MKTATLNEKKLKSIVKESVREIFEQELMKLQALAVPEIAEKEQKDIDSHFGKPSRKTAVLSSRSYFIAVY